jgi:hypothetical protein
MTDNHVRLIRQNDGSYSGRVTVIGCGLDTFDIRVVSSAQAQRSRGIERTWMVEGVDDDRWFGTLLGARQYLNRFYEKA